jgi:phospholipid transport system substrate-binding protein
MNSGFDRRDVLAKGTLAVMLLIGVAAVSTRAESAEDAAKSPPSAIGSFYAVLLDAMKHAKALGIQGRYQKLVPAVDATFDFQAMTSIAVGSAWAGIPQDKRTALIEAFGRLTTATYAKNFDDYNGERFEVDPNAQSRSGLMVVHSTFYQPNKDPVSIDYPMHAVGDGWKAVDVYYSGTVSQLAQRRSEFSSILNSSGADGLLKRLNQLGDQLLKGS